MTMDKLLTLEMKLVSNNGRCHILRNVLIENSFELVWRVGVFLSDSVSKLQTARKSLMLNPKLILTCTGYLQIAM